MAPILVASGDNTFLVGAAEPLAALPGLSEELSVVLKGSALRDAQTLASRHPRLWPLLAQSWGGLCFSLYASSVWKSSILHGRSRDTGPLARGRAHHMSFVKILSLFQSGHVGQGQSLPNRLP